MKAPLCLIIGFGPGMGYALAKKFASQGFALGLIARRAEVLHDYTAEFVKAGVPCENAALSIADFEALKAGIASIEAKLGATQVLIYNASVGRQSLPQALDPAELVEDFKVNCAGALVAVQAVLPGMKARSSDRRGSIFITGGGLALEPYPVFSALAVGKAAVRSLALSLHGELSAQRIQVATVTIKGMIKVGTDFDPVLIAEKYWELYQQAPNAWEREVTFG